MKMHNKLQALWMLLILMVPMLLMVPVANALPPANDDFANATVINSLPFQDIINTSEASAKKTTLYLHHAFFQSKILFGTQVHRVPIRWLRLTLSEATTTPL